MVRQATRDGTALSSIYRVVHVAVHAPTQKPVRYVGVYTDGGQALRQHGVDNLYAPVSLYLSEQLELSLILIVNLLPRLTVTVCCNTGSPPILGRATAARARPTSTSWASLRCASLNA